MLVDAKEEPEERDVLLEDAGFEDLRFCLTQIRRQIWDEEQFKAKLCYKNRETLSKSSLSSFLRELFRRKQLLEKLERRVQAILDERSQQPKELIQ